MALPGRGLPLLQVNEATLRQWADHGHLRVYRTPGGHRRFYRDDVLALTKSNPKPRNLPPRPNGKARPSAASAAASPTKTSPANPGTKASKPKAATGCASSDAASYLSCFKKPNPAAAARKPWKRP